MGKKFEAKITFNLPLEMKRVLELIAGLEGYNSMAEFMRSLAREKIIEYKKVFEGMSEGENLFVVFGDQRRVEQLRNMLVEG